MWHPREVVEPRKVEIDFFPVPDAFAAQIEILGKALFATVPFNQAMDVVPYGDRIVMGGSFVKMRVVPEIPASGTEWIESIPVPITLAWSKAFMFLLPAFPKLCRACLAKIGVLEIPERTG
jgi:hypothetical protein